MAFKVLLLCASALLVQSIYGNCSEDAVIIIEDSCNCVDSNSGSCISGISIDNIGSNCANNIGSSGNCGSNSNYNSYSVINNPKSKSGGTSSVTASSGPFFITCSGPVVPNGVTVNSNNNLAGDLIVAGQLPFLSAVGFEGSFPSSGLASVSYGCGDGNISIQEVIGGSSGLSASPTSSGASITSVPPGPFGSSSTIGSSSFLGYSGSYGASSGCKYY